MSAPETLAVTTERTGTTVRVAACGELDLATAPKLLEHADRCLADHAEVIVLDLSGVSFIDSTGIRAILDATQRGSDRVRIIPSAVCLRLFDIVGLTARLPLVADGNVPGRGARGQRQDPPDR